MLTNLLDTTESTTTLVSLLPTIFWVILAIYMVMATIHYFMVFLIPFHIAGINNNQNEIAEEEKKQTKIAQETLDVEKQRLQLEEQRLQIEIEKLNLVRAKQNLPPYTPKSIDSKPTTTPEPEQEKPAV